MDGNSYWYADCRGDNIIITGEFGVCCRCLLSTLFPEARCMTDLFKSILKILSLYCTLEIIINSFHYLRQILVLFIHPFLIPGCIFRLAS